MKNLLRMILLLVVVNCLALSEGLTQEASYYHAKPIVIEGLALYNGQRIVEFNTVEIAGAEALYLGDEYLNIILLAEDNWEGELKEYKLFIDGYVIGYLYEREDGTYMYADYMDKLQRI